MKAKWRTTLMIAMFSGVLAVGTAASAGGMGGFPAQGTGKGHTFIKLDENSDGHISQQEAATNPTLADHFKRFDKNNNGQLDQGEFSRFETMERSPGESMERETMEPGTQQMDQSRDRGQEEPW